MYNDHLCSWNEVIASVEQTQTTAVHPSETQVIELSDEALATIYGGESSGQSPLGGTLAGLPLAGLLGVLPIGSLLGG